MNTKEQIEQKVCYRNLSPSLKVAVIVAWVYGILFAIGFLLGFLGL